MKRLRPVFVRRFSWLASFSIAALILVVTASTTYAVNPAKLLPPGLRPAESNLSAEAGLCSASPTGLCEDLVFGESQIAVNPTNPDNVIYMSLTHKLSQACEDSGDPNCGQVNRVIRDGPVAFPIGPGPAGFFFGGPGFAHNTLFVSFNKGQSWQAVVAPCCPPDHPEMDNQGDPSITVGPDGTFYIVWDSINWGDDPNFTLPNGGVPASKSTDGGLTWSTPVLTLTAMDGPKVVADPNTGRVYAHSSGAIGTRTATGNPSDPLFFNVPTPSDRYVAASDDGVNWTPPQRFGAGAVSAGGGLTAAHGVIATAARFTQEAQCETLLGADPATQAPCVVFSTSTDDGQTWARQAVNAPDLTPPAGLPPGGGGILVAADPTTPGHFSIAGFRPLGGFAVYQTTDGGATWTGPAVVTDPHPFGETRAAMAYSLDGTLGLGWRAYTEAPSGGQIAAPFRVYAAVSDDGGATFTNPLEVGGPSPKPPRPGFHNNADHYSGIAFGEDRLYFSWADSRTPERSAFDSEVKLDAFFHPANQ